MAVGGCEGLQRGDMGASGPSVPSDPLQQRELLSYKFSGVLGWDKFCTNMT